VGRRRRSEAPPIPENRRVWEDRTRDRPARTAGRAHGRTPAVKERLHKVMAACGAGSRRQCETFIAEGRVEVDGEIVDRPGVQVDPATQEIRFDGRRLRPRAKRYYLLNKPRGVICSQRGDPDRPRAVDLLPPEVADERLYTVGRLDVESEGALLLTNDGELCHRVTHPSFAIAKTYRVEVDGVPDAETLAKMRRGVWLSEGRTGGLEVRVLKRWGKRSLLQVTLTEGMNREVRRVCARFGHEVRRLQRVSIGPIRLGRLPVGEARPLRPAELAKLESSADVVIRLGRTRAKGPRAPRGRVTGRRGPSRRSPPGKRR